ncbi:MAG: hypothetical protein VSS75_023920 [Candidatus Parabeggiatoa sp.]|nr:hypothetical protein [Candidatus Parabeggiatoa sp.]
MLRVSSEASRLYNDAKKHRREASRQNKKSSSHSIFLTFVKSNF